MLKWICFLIDRINKKISTPILYKDKPSISWSDYYSSETKSVTIVLFSLKDCSICEEIKLWMENLWVPFILVDCKRVYPTTIPKVRTLMDLAAFKCSDGKNRGLVFLPGKFPIVEFINSDGGLERIGGNSEILRNAITEFIAGNIGAFPGFEAGVYGTDTPEQQVEKQRNAVLAGIERNKRRKSAKADTRKTRTVVPPVQKPDDKDVSGSMEAGNADLSMPSK